MTVIPDERLRSLLRRDLNRVLDHLDSSLVSRRFRILASDFSILRRKFRVLARDLSICLDYLDGMALKRIQSKYGMIDSGTVLGIVRLYGCPRRNRTHVRLPRNGSSMTDGRTRKRKSLVTQLIQPNESQTP